MKKNKIFPIKLFLKWCKSMKKFEEETDKEMSKQSQEIDKNFQAFKDKRDMRPPFEPLK